MIHRRLAILGAGHMGRALIAGLLRSGTRAEHIQVGEQLAAARTALAGELGVSASADNAAAVEGAAAVVLAVRPQETEAVLCALAGRFGQPPPLLISLVAGLRCAQLKDWCGLEVVRAMPNRAAFAGAAATGLYAPPGLPGAHRALAEQVLGSVGTVVGVASEAALDVVTALSGSGPAYFFLLAECMAHTAERLGLEARAARTLAVATLHGSGLLAHAGDGDLARLRAEIASPGGTTEAALKVLEAGGLRTLIDRALEAAAQRARELAAVQHG